MTTTGSDRIATLDIVRGVAVMGILLMNIVGFGMPQSAYVNPTAYGDPGPVDLGLWALMFVTIDGKMRGLFSFLFGASMLLVADRAAAGSGNPASVHYRRMLWLLLFGLAHLYLIWWGDILAHYALVGAIAFLFRDRPTPRLVILALLFIAIQLILMTMMDLGALTAWREARAPGATPEQLAAWAGFKASFGTPTAAQTAGELAAYRGGYGDVLVYRWAADQLTPVVTFFFIGAETLAYMLLGMAGLRSGMLTGDWPRRRYIRWAAIGFGIGLPGYAMLAGLLMATGFDTLIVILALFVLSTALRPAMIIGWAALIVLVVRPGSALTERIAAAGRMAFSNYIGTSLICTTLFYGYGLGLYGRVGHAGLYAIAFGICLLMLLWSKPWLDRFAYGPLEWLWRSLARWKIQPMRRTRAIAT